MLSMRPFRLSLIISVREECGTLVLSMRSLSSFTDNIC